MWQYAVEAGLMVLDFVYHRFFYTPPVPKPAAEIAIPRTDDGAPFSLIYGQCLVKSPVLAYCCTPVNWVLTLADNSASVNYYGMSMLFVLGIPFQGGLTSTNRIVSMYVGAKKCHDYGPPASIPLASLTPDGQSGIDLVDLNGPICGVFASPSNTNTDDNVAPWGVVNFMDGSPVQLFMSPTTDLPRTVAGMYMSTSNNSHPGHPEDNLNGTTPAKYIPSYRGVMSVFLSNQIAVGHWAIGTDPTIDSYGFEVSSYPNPSLAPQPVDPLTNIADANPVDVIYDLLTGGYGKIGMDPSLIDTASFAAAGVTLFNEGHGYSRSIEGGGTGVDIITSILEQIDAALYTDPTTGLLKIKLIRPDYDPNTIPAITPDNCEALQNYAAGGWTDIPNRVRIVFTDRSNDYQDNSATAINGSNSLLNNPNEIVLQMPGITTAALAQQIAARELAARSRPIAKCTAIVNREFYTVCPGDAVSVTWPEANIAGMIFRVAAVSRGKLANGKIQLDLIQDYFYQWRDSRPVNPAGIGFPTSLPSTYK